MPSLPPQDPLSALQLPPLTDEQKTAVRSWIAAATRDQERWLSLWNRNLKAYAPGPDSFTDSHDSQADRYAVNPNVDFRQAEQKKSQLWFETADIQLSPIEPLSDTVLASVPQPDGTSQDQTLATILALHQEVLNQTLSPQGVNAKRTLQEAILDCLVPSGWGVTQIGYTSFTRTVETPDPLTGLPRSVPVPVTEKYFWRRLSPARLLVPVGFLSTDFDEAPWLGVRFAMPRSEARREYGAIIPPDHAGNRSSIDKLKLGDDDQQAYGGTTGFDPLLTGVLLFYYEPTLQADPSHPERVCELVFVDGLDDPVRHRYCPYQTLDQEGRLSADSMIGYPIHVLTLRDTPDSHFVLSDSSMTRELTDELVTYRSQILKSRDASIPYALYDEDILPPEKIERITSGDYGPMIPVEGGRLNAANPPVIPGNKPQLSRETYAGQDVIERDIDRTHAIGANQNAQPSTTRKTATEVATMQQNLNTRLAGEQQRVVEFFCAGVRKLDALVQRYADKTQMIRLLGQDGAYRWLQWNKAMLAGRYAYSIKPDSQIHQDAAADRQQDLAFYNLTARDPCINRYELARRLALKWNFNPDKLCQPPPQPGPPPPNVQVRVMATDLDPRLPQFPIVLEILTQSGYQISPDALNNAMMVAGQAQVRGELPQDVTLPKEGDLAARPQPQPPHPGAAEQVEPISKHQSDLTGAIPGPGPAIPRPGG